MMRRGEQIIQKVTTWPQVKSQSHQFGGVEFNVGKVEIGHIHGDTLLDIPYTRAIRDILVRSGETQPHHVLPESGWTSFHLHHDSDVAHALKLLRLSYIQKRIRRFSSDEREMLLEEVRQMNFSPELLQLLEGHRDTDELDEAKSQSS
jgi:Ni,Fe-hydrogenase I large subunit